MFVSCSQVIWEWDKLAFPGLAKVPCCLSHQRLCFSRDSYWKTSPCGRTTGVQQKKVAAFFWDSLPPIIMEVTANGCISSRIVTFYQPFSTEPWLWETTNSTSKNCSTMLIRPRSVQLLVVAKCNTFFLWVQSCDGAVSLSIPKIAATNYCNTLSRCHKQQETPRLHISYNSEEFEVVILIKSYESHCF